MATNNITPTMDLISTACEVLPNGTMLDLVREEGSSEVGFLALDGDRYRIVDCVEYDGKTYVPARADPTVLGALRLPTRAASYTSTEELFEEICKVLALYNDLPERFLLQIVYFIFGTWLVDRVPIAPFLSIVAPATAPGGVLLQLLALFCRRSLLLTAENPAGLWTLPMYLRPTLLLDAAELSVPVQRFLRASNSQGIHFPRKGQALDLYCAKAVCSSEPLSDPSLASLALQISLAPTRRELPGLSEEASHQIAEEFQAKMLMYRIKKYSYVRPPDLHVAGLTAPTQCLARSLAACIVDDYKLQVGLVALLHQQDREFQVERSSGLESVILEALLFCCHEGGRSTVRAAELAEITNNVLAKRSEILRISPETVGHRLKSLGLRTESIGSRGNGLWLLCEVRAKIHKLAREYGVQQDPVNECTQCLEPCDKPQKEEEMAGEEERLQEDDDDFNLSESDF
jgi:hypothetical protein